MPKRIAVIDIGSNSARLVIFQRTSRYGFHLILQQKSRVRIGEGAYEHGGHLQPVGIRRAFGALHSFSHTLKEYKVHKVHCVATSALRDAPNRSQFLALVRKRLGLKIKVIDGLKEARYGAVAALNLLPVEEGITVDIGGGSTDMALIQKGKIVETVSLDLGTVRIKELFTDKGLSPAEARKYIRERLAALPEHFRSSLAIGIGGTARALARGIMLRNDYPFDKIHAFSYSFKKEKDYLKKLIESPIDRLGDLMIKKNRFDTIREGAHIFLEVLRHLEAKEVLTSGVGVREGVFLSDLLRRDGLRFPRGINPSIRSIKDRFDLLKLPEGNKHQIGRRLFEAIRERYESREEDLSLLNHALSLSNIGKMLTIYKEHQHAFYIAMQELNFGFTHSQMLTIALLMRSKGDSLYYKPLYRRYKSLLPSKEVIKWLSFAYTLTLILYENSSEAKISFSWKDNTLQIHSDRPLYLAHEEIESLKTPKGVRIELLDGWDELVISN
ncbi:Ppx/GppA phosphatase family protein [Nitratifractor salsuginis]|uniref:Ppx/GppA phosphatase n=1 Tax=Nitratifractor salsuginis (strain DSM 16511 / JCM 12458 / E9I37-1) TaxID=749222 RepID=E6X2F1_NITSE|nr:Ppx/GppA phosphatase family protein [Nitratifractor salsuginis]ADV47156.1 Ppx/GppA phosphatase [Nitratifractor salsuginis DSM 16511]